MSERVTQQDQALEGWQTIAFAALIGCVLGLGVAFSPIGMLVAVPGLLLVLGFLAGWPLSGVLLIVAASFFSRYRLEVAGLSIRAEHVAVILGGGLWAWQAAVEKRRIRLDRVAVFAFAWWLTNAGAAVFHAPDVLDSMRHVIRLSLLILTYLVVDNLLTTRSAWWLTFWSYLALGVLEDVFGIVARLVYPLGINLGVQVAWVLTEPVPYGTMEEGNIFGAHSAAWLVGLLALVLLHPLWTRRQKIGLWAGAAITALAVVASLSRGAWVALIVGMMLLAFVYARAGHGRATYIGLAIALLVIAGVIAGLLVLDQQAVITRLQTFANLRIDATVSMRLQTYAFGLSDWRRYPWLGWGPGTFYQLYGDFWGMPAWLSNMIVRTLQETGLIGLGFFVAFLASVLYQAIRALTGSARLSSLEYGALVGLLLGMVVILVAYQATDGTWLAAMWVHAALLTSGARLLTTRDISSVADS